MSSVTSKNTTELSLAREEMDNSKITINTNNSKLILENNSTDITISKYEVPTTFANVPSTTNSSLPLKTQVLPLVYIQNSTKIPFPSANKTSSNVIVNNIPPFQFATLGANMNRNNNTNTPTTSTTLSTNQNVIFATGRPQPLVLQKQQGNVVPITPVSVPATAKIAGAYLTMLKPVPKPSEATLANKMQISTSNIPKMQDFSLLNNNTYMQSSNHTQKFVIAPMPKVTTNRIPATATTNSVQSKIALLPMPVPKTEPTVTKQKVYNFKITDGQLQGDATSSTVTIMCDNVNNSNENSMDADSNSENLVCDEVIDLNSPEKNDVTNKTYELSITEESMGSQSDLRVNSSIVVTNIPSTNAAKDIQKFPKHGVSILKKSHSSGLAERKIDRPNSIIICNTPNSKNSVSENKELSVIKPTSKPEEDVVVTIPTHQPAKPEKERRRKSNFSYRKEFDEMEVIPSSNRSFAIEPLIKPSVSKQIPVEASKKCLSSEIEIEVIKEKKDEDYDAIKVLNWEDGVGTLPGSNIKFIVNEFNLLEYITEEEYKKIKEKQMVKAKEKVKTDFQEEMRCLECGCFGLPSEFINPKFCSYDCQEAAQSRSKKDKQDQYKKKKKKNKKEVETIIKPETKQEKESSEEDSNDNSSHEKLMSYPWACKKKGFSWSKYLEHVKAKPAPVKLFKDPFPYTRNGFRPGMKLEGVDPQHPSYFCVLTVAEIVGYRLRLHFDGYPDNYDFWCNADSMDIFPMGWCEKYGHVLQPPPGHTMENFNWVQYLKQTKSTAAPKHLFANRAGQAICPNGFRVGMKLEAVDRKNTSLVCVATVRDMMDNRILVHFDSWDDIYDYWADPTSPYIHPVGWCDQYGHNLTPPNDKSKTKKDEENLIKDYPNPESFSWEVYLKETKSVAAPVRAFKQRPTCGFKRGMRLECVDKRVPQLIRVATVDDVKEHQIRIHFDGWLDRYSYWVDDDSPDIHPMGWCQKTGHPIEPPLTPDDVYDFLECPTVGCRGQGHIKGSQYATHSSQKYCPYAEENVDAEKILPDRLLSPDRSPEAVVPVSREPKECKIKPRLGRPPKYIRLEQPKSEPPEEPPEKKPRKKYKKQEKSTVPELNVQKATAFIEQSKILPVERESWRRHSHFLRKYVSTDVDPRRWNNTQVVNFISSMPYCEQNSAIFREQQIDGEAFLSLSQKDILTILNIKVGPAVKLYNSIVLLRQHVDNKVFT